MAVEATIYVWRSGTLVHASRNGDWATSTDEADAVDQVRQSADDPIFYGEPASGGVLGVADRPAQFERLLVEGDRPPTSQTDPREAQRQFDEGTA